MTTYTLPAVVAKRLADKQASLIHAGPDDIVDIRHWPEYSQSHPGLTFTGTFDSYGRPIWMMTHPTHPPFTFAEPADTIPAVGIVTAAIAPGASVPSVASPSIVTSPIPSPPLPVTTSDAPGSPPPDHSL